MPARILTATWTTMWRLIAAIARDRRGATAVFLAVSLVPIVGAVGLAVDSSIGYLLRTRMSKSLDAAGLAAGRVALDANAKDVARQYFDANFGKGGTQVTVTDFQFKVDTVTNQVTLSAHATTPTVFMRVFGHDTMTVAANTVIQRATSGMEVALVLDNTGSLWDPKGDSGTDITGTNFKALQDAALNLTATIYGTKTEIDNVWMSLVPYVATVNIGPTRTDWLDKNDQAIKTPANFGSKSDGTGYGWKGCVMARAYPWDTDDSTPATHPFSSFLYPKNTSDNNWPTINDDYKATNAARKGPNLGCGTPITPLTKSRTTIDAGINAMKPWRRGGTAGNLGLVWGWRTISPKWRGLWGDAKLPLDYNVDGVVDDKMDKVVVILTDGNNEFNTAGSPTDYTAYGRVNMAGPVGLAKSTKAEGVTELNKRMTTICNSLRTNGVLVYTIIFGSAPSAATKTLYESCATTPAMYYYAKSSSDVGGVFKSIGGQLANLYIIK